MPCPTPRVAAIILALEEEESLPRVLADLPRLSPAGSWVKAVQRHLRCLGVPVWRGCAARRAIPSQPDECRRPGPGITTGAVEVIKFL